MDSWYLKRKYSFHLLAWMVCFSRPSEDIFSSFQPTLPYLLSILYDNSSSFGDISHFLRACILLLKVMVCTSLGTALYFLRNSVVATNVWVDPLCDVNRATQSPLSLLFEWTPCLWCYAGQPNLHSPSRCWERHHLQLRPWCHLLQGGCPQWALSTPISVVEIILFLCFLVFFLLHWYYWWIRVKMADPLPLSINPVQDFECLS